MFMCYVPVVDVFVIQVSIVFIQVDLPSDSKIDSLTSGIHMSGGICSFLLG